MPAKRLIRGRPARAAPKQDLTPAQKTRQLTMLEDNLTEQQTRDHLNRAASASLDEWARLLRFVLGDQRVPVPQFSPFHFTTCLKWLEGSLVARLSADGDLFVQTPDSYGAQPMKNARQAFDVILEAIQKDQKQ
jgi:hypothetical protein